MARSRNIKPGFFTNEQLAELAFETRLLFIGLWTLADREGRLEDRPKRIKMALFPADSVDVDAMLDDLADGGLITRYAVQGGRYIEISNFLKHQNPHYKEAPSILPAPGYDPDDQPENPRLHPQSSNTEPEASPSIIDRSSGGEPEADPGRAVLIPDSLLLIPDSGYLIPDCGGAPSGADRAPPPERKSKSVRRVPADWQPDPVDPEAVRLREGVDIERQLLAFRAHTFPTPVHPDEFQDRWIRWLIAAWPQPAGVHDVSATRAAAAQWDIVATQLRDSRRAHVDDPDTARIVADLGGWHELGRCSQFQLESMRREFVRRYSAGPEVSQAAESA